jgi:hypothetical protein
VTCTELWLLVIIDIKSQSKKLVSNEHISIIKHLLFLYFAEEVHRYEFPASKQCVLISMSFSFCGLSYWGIFDKCWSDFFKSRGCSGVEELHFLYQLLVQAKFNHNLLFSFGNKACGWMYGWLDMTSLLCMRYKEHLNWYKLIKVMLALH